MGEECDDADDSATCDRDCTLVTCGSGRLLARQGAQAQDRPGGRPWTKPGQHVSGGKRPAQPLGSSQRSRRAELAEDSFPGGGRTGVGWSGGTILFVHAYDEAPVIKKLSAVGDSLALIIERPILELLDITKDTPLEITTDGEALIIRPAKTLSQMDRVVAAADEIMDAHEETFRKLAQ
jgi:antitoxin component of MazEF toxin-antitoxin module